MSNGGLAYIIGGGPGGLFAARLLKLANPDWEVRLFERLPPGETFGFGVGLTGGTLRALRAADPAVHDDLLKAAFSYSTAEFRLRTGVVEIPGFHSGVAIGRAELLRILSRHAEQAGVIIDIQTAPEFDDLAAEADLVIAADGVSSAVREQYAADFGARVETGRPYFIWCGSTARIDGAVFGPAQTEFGTIVMHAYPYAPDRSTYVFETNRRTLERGGFLDRAWDSEAASDEEALALLSEAFRDVVGGAPMIGNKSRWTQFRTVTCEKWSRHNAVLLGDAAATAHPSIGSGTKLAMESAILLVEALGSSPEDVEAALIQFEHDRRPSLERLQMLAHRSHLWWESLEQRLHLTPARLAAAYLSRAGAVSLTDLGNSAPVLAVRAAADFAGVDSGDVPSVDLAGWVLQRPLEVGGERHHQRVLTKSESVAAEVLVDFDDPWGELGDAAVEHSRALLAQGASAIRLTGAASQAAVQDRLAFGERLRSSLNAVVEVELDSEFLPAGSDGLVAGRTDLLVVTDELVSAQTGVSSNSETELRSAYASVTIDSKE